MGAGKTVHDYRSVGEEYKRKVLLNDVVVLTASSAGMLGYKAFGKNKIINEKFLKPTVEFVDKQFKKLQRTDFVQKNFIGKFDNLFKKIHTPVEYSKNIIANCISNTAMVGAGLFAAILADLALTKSGNGIHKIKDKKQENIDENPKKINQVDAFMHKKVGNVVSKNVQQEMFWRLTDFKAFNAFNSAFVGLAGLKITDEKKHSKQVRKASKYLIYNTMIPLLFFSIASELTKKMKNIYRFPIMFVALVTGSLLVKHAIDNRQQDPKN